MDATTAYSISGLSSREISPLDGGFKTGKTITKQPPRSPPAEDTVELSSAGIERSQADVQSPQQDARISELRAEIKAETFLTPERLDGTVERLIEIICRAGKTT